MPGRGSERKEARIDPPFDSKADYKKEISVKGKLASNDSSAFEEKQYGDIWSNDEYLQFMFDRIVLLKELLSDAGSIFLHCDWHRGHHLRAIMDEVFGSENFVNEIIWRRKGGSALGGMSRLSVATDRLLWYSKSPNYTFNPVYMAPDPEYVEEQFRHTDSKGRRYMVRGYFSTGSRRVLYSSRSLTPICAWRNKRGFALVFERRSCVAEEEV